MERIPKRTIEEVLDYETGEQIIASDFFKKPLDELHYYRSELQKAIQGIRDLLFTCYYCKQKIRIRGGISSSYKRKADIFHFAHLKDSDECHIKTKNQYTKDECDRIKYNGAKESLLHQKLKENIAECLRRNEATKKEVRSVEVEKVIRDKVVKEWKKPDINSFFNDKRIAIELQLSTTWLDVITKRQHFYKEQGIYIFWVFHVFNTNDDSRKLTYNDVIYTNNQNAYIFDEEAYILSQKENDFILKCWYKIYSSEGPNIQEDWEFSFIKLSDLTFDEKKVRIYYNDTETQKKEVEKEIENYNRELRESGRLKILDQQEKEKKLQILKAKIDDSVNDINVIKENIKELDQKISNTNIKIEEVKDNINRIEEITESTISYLENKRMFSRPFNNYDELLKIIKDEFGEQIKIPISVISEKKQELETITINLTNINKLSTIEVAGKKYTCLDNSVNWDFIRQNYEQIKIINKNSVSGLFAGDELKPIKNLFDLNRHQFSKDFYFLIDLSSKIFELTEKDKTNQEIIGNQEKIIDSAKKKIKIQLKNYFISECNEIESKLINYLNKQRKIDYELKKKETELINLKLVKII